MNFKEIDKLKEFCQVEDLTRIMRGVANEVYEATINDKKIIIKYYQKDPNFLLIDKLMQTYHKLRIETLEILKRGKLDDRTVCIYPYIGGVHRLILNEKEIEKILEIIISRNQEDKVYELDEHNLFHKYQQYYQYFLKRQWIRIDSNIMEEILKKASEIELDFKKVYLTHGDLSPYNIIWKKEKPVIIDLDECSLAPYYYEFVVFLIKFCFNHGTFDLEQGQKIMKCVFSSLKINIKEFRDTWYFYITKVLLEKLYYYDLGYIDLEDENQSKDSYHWWVDLLKEDTILNNLLKYK